MFKQLISILAFSLITSSPVLAGVSNCELKVTDAVKEIFKHDSNANGEISVRESLAAYDYFDPMIGDLSKMESKKVREALYTYILKYEILPGRDFSFSKWMANRIFWKYTRNESQVRNAMKALYQCQ